VTEAETLHARWPSGLTHLLASISASLVISVVAIGYSMVRGAAVPLDPYALASRFIGLAAALRGGLGLHDAWPLLRQVMARKQLRLVLSQESIELLGDPNAGRAALGDVAAVVETPRDGVWLLLRGTPGPRTLVLPPVFDLDEGALAERLMRMLPVEDTTRERPVSPPGLPSLRYDEAARGTVSVGALALRPGLGWARRGPYAAPLFAVTLAWSVLQAPGAFEVGPLFTGLFALCLAVPTLWLLAVRRVIAPRKGLALLLTPEEVLLRTRGGVSRTPFAALTSVQLMHSGSWTLLEGSRPQLELVFEREGDRPLRYDASFFRWPAEVVQAALEAYRRGDLP